MKIKKAEKYLNKIYDKALEKPDGESRKSWLKGLTRKECITITTIDLINEVDAGGFQQWIDGNYMDDYEFLETVLSYIAIMIVTEVVDCYNEYKEVCTAVYNAGYEAEEWIKFPSFAHEESKFNEISDQLVIDTAKFLKEKKDRS